MKKLILLYAIGILGALQTQAQTISHMWSRAAGGSNNDAAHGIEVDASGNVYTAGYFYGTVDFDPGPGTLNLTSAGSYDIFVQKLDANGSLLWVKQIGGSAGSEVAFALDVDPSGNIHFTGYFVGTVDFDPGVGTANLTSSSGADVYVCKLDNNGNYIWAVANSAASTQNEQGMGIAVDGSGNVYYTGLFRTNMDVNPGGPTVTIYTGAGNLQVFMIKLDATGAYVWGKGFNGTGTSVGNAIALDPTGSDVYITGYYSGTVDVDPTAPLLNRTAVGQNDIFIEKLSSAGTFGWCINYGSSYNEAGQGIAITAAGITATGSFAGTIDFDAGAGTANMQTDLMSGNTDVYVLRLTTAGAYSWSKSIGGTGVDAGYATAVDQSGNVYTTGYFSGTADLNPSATTQNATSAGVEDIFVMKLDGSGNFIWSGALGSAGADMGNAIFGTSANNVYYAGHYSGSMDFNPGAGTTTLANSGMRDIFVSRWNQCTAAPSAPGVISGATPVCVGSTQTYSVTAVAGVTYTWTLPGLWSGSSNSNSIAATVGAGSGNITCTASNGCGTSSTSTLAVTHATMPVTPSAISGSATVCAGNVVTYSVTPVAGITYAWTLPGGWPGGSPSNVVTSTAGSSSGTVSVTASNVCGTSSASTLAVTSSAIPAMPSVISGPDTMCPGAINTYSVTPVAGVTYNWTLPPSWTGNSTSNSITATAGTASGFIEVTATNSCGTSVQSWITVVVNNIPTNLGPLTGQSPICEGSTQVYTVASYPGATYTWTLPATWTGNSTTNSLTAIAGSAGGTLSVVASNACGTGNPSSYNIAVTNIPASPVNIGGPDTVCGNSNATYSCSSMPGATSYTWTLPGGWSGSSTSTSINVVTGNISGTVQVTANNTCGSSVPNSYSVFTDTVPLAPAAITGTSVLCENSPYVFTCSSVANATTYNWTYPSGWTGTTSANSLNGIVDSNGGLVSVSVTNLCGTSNMATLSVTVNPMPVTSITTTGGGMVADELNATYQWLDCVNSMSTIAGATAQQFVPSSNGSYAVEVNLNGCIDTSACDSFLTAETLELNRNIMLVYPNPTYSEVYLPGVANNTLIEVCDLTGRIVKEVYYSGALSLSELAAGTYVLRVYTEDGTFTKSIQKQ